MGTLYLITGLITIIIGCLLHFTFKKINIYEWFLAIILGFIIMGITHSIMWHIKTSDFEYYNANVVKTVYEPPWVQSYTCCKVYGQCCSGSGKDRSCHSCCKVWGTCYRNKGDNYYMYLSNDVDFQINQNTYNVIMKKCGPKYNVPGERYNYYSGSRDDIHSKNIDDNDIPVTYLSNWVNKIKLNKNLFTYKNVDPIKNNLPNYPKEQGPSLEGKKVIGEATKYLSQFDIDAINGRIGPSSFANLMVVGFANRDENTAELLRSYWFGGKKNDVIIVFDVKENKIDWVQTFGWSKKDLFKQNINTLLIGKDPNDIKKLLPNIKYEIEHNYRLNDMDDYNYLSMDVEGAQYWCILIGFACIIIIYFIIAYKEDIFNIGD